MNTEIQNPEVQRLAALRSLDILDTCAEPVFDSFTQLAAAVTGLPIALLALVDERRVWFKSALGATQGAHILRDGSMCEFAISSDDLLEVEDARLDKRFCASPTVTGEPKIVHYAGMPITMPTGERIGTICVLGHEPGRLDERSRETLKHLARSIVEVVVLREDDRRTHLRVKAKREKLDLALETSGQGLWEFWPNEDRVVLSKAWGSTFGFADRRELKSQDLINMVSADAVEPLFKGIRDLVLGRIPKFALEYQQKDASGNLRWVRNEGQIAERDSVGAAVRLVGIVRDISATKELEERLTLAARQAEKASRAKGDFLATMSHEIRTPINGVIGLSRILTASHLPPEEARYVSLIDSCAKTLLSLVDNILDFSKIEAGQMNLERADTNLLLLLRETSDVFAVRAEDKGLSFKFKPSPDLPAWISTDPLRLRQVLLNLLGNALKFTQKGEVGLGARLERHGAEENLVLVVSDTGIGINPEQHAAIFERYTQADIATYREYSGTGLGLSISKEIVNLMGGSITLESTPGVGSVFTVRVPLIRAVGQAHVACARPERHGRSDAVILLAEDDLINQMVAEAVLEDLGYTNVRIAGDGEEALEIARREPVHLVLMDCNMPKMDGIDATRELRRRGFVGPIIALTAGATLQDKRDCLEAGMNDYLTKPMEPASLAHALNHWLTAA